MPAVAHYVLFGAGLAVIAGLTTGLATWAGARLGWLPVRALFRAALQLTVIALLLRGILSWPVAVIGFVALMLTTASWTAASRLKELWHGRRIAVAGVLAGASVSVTAVFALGLVTPGVRYLIAVGGILIGNSMTAATLAGRNFLRGARAQREVIEGMIALGASASQAHSDVAREALREALLPTLDQTRATGLVTLPGAFVGALFGGLSPAAAAEFQLVVLAGIALTMVITGIVVTRLAARTPYLVPPE